MNEIKLWWEDKEGIRIYKDHLKKVIPKVQYIEVDSTLIGTLLEDSLTMINELQKRNEAKEYFQQIQDLQKKISAQQSAIANMPPIIRTVENIREEFKKQCTYCECNPGQHEWNGILYCLRCKQRKEELVEYHQLRKQANDQTNKH